MSNYSDVKLLTIQLGLKKVPVMWCLLYIQGLPLSMVPMDLELCGNIYRYVSGNHISGTC